MNSSKNKVASIVIGQAMLNGEVDRLTLGGQFSSVIRAWFAMNQDREWNAFFHKPVLSKDKGCWVDSKNKSFTGYFMLKHMLKENVITAKDVWSSTVPIVPGSYQVRTILNLLEGVEVPWKESRISLKNIIKLFYESVDTSLEKP